MNYRVLFLIATVLFAVVNLSADILYDRALKGVVTRATKTTVVSAQLVADSNGAYQGKTIIFGSSNANIQNDARLVLNFYADYDSIAFDPPLLVAPEVGCSIFVLPTFSFDFADTGESAEAVKERILRSPYNKIAADTAGNVQTLADAILGARVGWRLRWFPTTTNPKDSVWVINPAAGNDSLQYVIKLYKTNNVTNAQQFEIR